MRQKDKHIIRTKGGVIRGGPVGSPVWEGMTPTGSIGDPASSQRVITNIASLISMEAKSSLQCQLNLIAVGLHYVIK